MPILKANGQGIFYEDSGGEGSAVLFLHGFLLDQSMFDPQVEALAPEFRCIRFDARAFGQTEWDGEAFSLDDTVADAYAVLDHLGVERAVFAGMSQGGYAALRAALEHPERVSGLVLMSTRSGVDEEAAKAGYREARDTWREHGPVDPLLEGMMSSILGPREQVGELWEVWWPRWKAMPGETIFHAMNNLLERDDIDPRLAEITCRALIVHGEEDLGIPIVLGEELDRDLRASEGLVRVPGAAHAANLTHPGVVNPPLLDFLRRRGEA